MITVVNVFIIIIVMILEITSKPSDQEFIITLTLLIGSEHRVLS